MGLSDIFKEAASKNLSPGRELTFKGDVKASMIYTEEVKDGLFTVKLASVHDPDAYVECSLTDTGLEMDENYCRLYFLSMVFNAAIFGMKRKNNSDKKSKPNGGQN